MTKPSTALLNDVLDPDKIQLVCQQHNYVAGGTARRHTGCVKCITVDYIYMFAKTPPELRQERLDQFEALIHTMCELEEQGKLNIDISRHPAIHIEKDALPD